MVVGEGVELVLVMVSIIVVYLLILGVERLTEHEGPPRRDLTSDTKE